MSFSKLRGDAYGESFPSVPLARAARNCEPCYGYSTNIVLGGEKERQRVCLGFGVSGPLNVASGYSPVPTRLTAGLGQCPDPPMGAGIARRRRRRRQRITTLKVPL